MTDKHHSSTTAAGPDHIVFVQDGVQRQAKYFAGETVLETARRAGIQIATSCENGECGTCVVEVLNGSLAMKQNNALSAEEIEQGCSLACQAIPASDSCTIEIY